MTEDHIPLDYRPEGESRHIVPADVCSTCSDLTSGRLVPVVFCEEARAKSDELYAWLQGEGLCPSWIPDIL